MQKGSAAPTVLPFVSIEECPVNVFTEKDSLPLKGC